MKKRWLVELSGLVALLLAAWIYRGGGGGTKKAAWLEVAPGVFRTAQLPAGYALVDGQAALLIDAPHEPAGLTARGVAKVEAVLLTHHHRDTCQAAARLLADGVPVRAPKAAADWLEPEKVRPYWQEAIPVRPKARPLVYLVVPTGLAGVDCTLEDGQTIDWHGWSLRVIAAPGHSPDHVAFAARKGTDGPSFLFCGDALAGPGKVWTPYTTDWDHWTDRGLKPAAASLRKLAGLKPAWLLPAHGPPISKDCGAVLSQTATAVEEVAFLKSYERYTKERLGHAPEFRFLAREQAASNGSLPWAQLSEHLFLTGNTYVLTSMQDNAFLVVDPWAELSARKIAKLKKDRALGPLEVVVFSHAHYDHYDGIYSLPDRDKFQVWALDRVAVPIAEPFRFRAPFLDARPVKFDRRFHDGEIVHWREYSFRFHHLPGQTEFTSGIETTIDGKKCYFTADNFFHPDQFSGSGGWMGLNRSFPLAYAASAEKVLDAAPDWVLAEHGGPFAFNAEDFRRRVRWAQNCAAAADAVCVSGNHRRDWDPNRVHVEPLLQEAKPGATVQGTIVATNPLGRREKLAVFLEGRGWTRDRTIDLEIEPGGAVQREFTLRLKDKIPAGRHVFALQVRENKEPAGCDAFVAVDVVP